MLVMEGHPFVCTEGDTVSRSGTNPREMLMQLPDARDWQIIGTSVIALTRGYLYAINPTEPQPAGLKELAQVIPLWVYGVAWLAAGTLGIWASLTRHTSKWSIAAMTGLYTGWAIAYLVSGFRDDPRYFLTAILFAALGLMTAKIAKVVALPREH